VAERCSKGECLAQAGQPTPRLNPRLNRLSLWNALILKACCGTIALLFWGWASAHFFHIGDVANLDPRIHEIIERVALRKGLELVHAELAGGRGNAFLRIYIDKPGGVTHEDCAHVSEEVGVILDVEDLIPHRYTLEVASPGLDRGLYKPADFERFAGHPVRIRLLEALNGQRNFRGRLIGLDSEGEPAAVLEDDQGHRHSLPLRGIARANLEIADI
jgi:ribosome maturation factor RimP